jgi:DNA polymerase elongation subunit (family B)
MVLANTVTNVFKGRAVRVGDHIQYVICEGDQSFAERAFHPDYVEKSDGLLRVDILALDNLFAFLDTFTYNLVFEPADSPTYCPSV